MLDYVFFIWSFVKLGSTDLSRTWSCEITRASCMQCFGEREGAHWVQWHLSFLPILWSFWPLHQDFCISNKLSPQKFVCSSTQACCTTEDSSSVRRYVETWRFFHLLVFISFFEEDCETSQWVFSKYRTTCEEFILTLSIGTYNLVW